MILCCGEALIDMIPTATVTGTEGFVPHLGGAVFNTAIALGRLGVQTGMLSGISTDMFGRQLVEGLKASHVDTSNLIMSDRPTTLAFVRLVGGHATYDFYDENSAGRMLLPEDMPALSDEVSALYFGGISLACEPGAEAYPSLLERNAQGRAVMLDPNIRPGFIRDIARYRERLDRMMALSNIVKVSDEDLNWLIPEPLSLREKTENLLAKGPSVVILTRGGEGATGYLTSGEEVQVSALKAEIVDTVGAGDTFNAGILAKLSELGQLHKSALADLSADVLTKALEHGARVAAITVSRAGANPPWSEEL
ncbi:carbohydrate kinase [Sulfitobacter sp. F26169L]|uniref:carbohydrate kinase family protein n=1 Tax=Sulfitobacter sp. F26169L TaxID=2996015 RepID=UPI00226097D9|nr:carbohydrate kinase [Sulfitobacter sp. F26169L]MCX7567669.1 carbohydrate kinase [Sulfitobacter sp. F26169L]